MRAASDWGLSQQEPPLRGERLPPEFVQFERPQEKGAPNVEIARGPAQVRPASDDEVENVLAMYHLLFEPPGTQPPDWDPAVSLARLRRLHAGRHGVILVAAIAGRLVGFCTVVLDMESVRFGQRAWIEDLAVAKPERSKGIGRALLDAARAWARREGATHIELDSAESRHDAHRFYEREAPTWRSVCYGWTLDVDGPPRPSGRT